MISKVKGKVEISPGFHIWNASDGIDFPSHSLNLFNPDYRSTVHRDQTSICCLGPGDANDFKASALFRVLTED
jgi:hypothetical protein